jgi:FlaA1/EpsC-like NDP-sugar epimerase
MDTNAFTTPFQLTKTLRRDIYNAIDPQNPELSAAGKTIVITGATGGIGGVRITRSLLPLSHTNIPHRK